MASYTTNFNLRKPANADTVNVSTDLSANFEAIDVALAQEVADREALTEQVFVPTAFTSAAIQAKIDAADAAGGGTVVCPPGEYALSLIDFGAESPYYALALMMRSNVTLRCAPGAVLKLANNASLPSGFSVLEAAIIGCEDLGPGLSNENIRIEDVVLDGNANNQSAVTAYAGISIFETTDAWVVNCKVKNFYGLGSSAPNETFHFDAVNARDVHFVECEADGSGATDTAAGFSANNSFSVNWTGCAAHDMAHSMGFTAWQSASLRWSGCHAYACSVQAGFNVERSEGIVYVGCASGGRSASVASGPSSTILADTEFGNEYGFQVQGCSNVVYAGCAATYNTYGLRIAANSAASPTLNCDTVTWIGGVLADNTTDNYSIDASQTGVWIDSSHGDGFRYVRADAPLIEHTAINGTSGLRTKVAGVGDKVWRLQVGSNDLINVAGGTAPVGGDSDRTDRYGDVAFLFNVTAEGVGSKYKTDATTIADADFAHRPANGTIAFTYDSASGLDSGFVRLNGSWRRFLKAASTDTHYVTRSVIGDGSAANPALAFSSDDDGSGTGLFRVGANDIGFSVNGTQVAHLNSSTFDMGTGAFTGAQFKSPSGTQAQFGSIGTNSVVLQTANTTRLTINSTGGFTVAASNKFTFAATATEGASVNLPHGAAPSAPADGDMWTTTAGLYVRINGATIGPLS